VVTDQQVRTLMKLNQTEQTFSTAAAKAGMSENTARKYRRSGTLPSQTKTARTWRTRSDPFEGVWDRIQAQLEQNPGLEAKTLFDWLQREHPGQYQDGQLRTLQRRIKRWRALNGPAKEVYFPQMHSPGRLCASDFTHMEELGVTIAGDAFPHLFYHFVLTYSNWETGTVCFSESFESLSAGFQNALWELGGVPRLHRTDRLTAAVQTMGAGGAPEFTRRYTSLLRHYGLEGQKTQAGQGHENGDVEQRHHRFKRAVEQALLLRGSRDFADRQAYDALLRTVMSQLNRGRQRRFREELAVLHRLPARRLNDWTVCHLTVGPSSTIRLHKNVYSVHSRLIGERIEVRVYAEHLEIWYAQRKIETLPRLCGSRQHHIQYRHIIDWLRRKPGAFEHYRYRSDLFPTSRFRMAYDRLKTHMPERAHKEYLQVLYLAATESETAVDQVLGQLLATPSLFRAQTVEALLADTQAVTAPTEVTVMPIDLQTYDQLLTATAPSLTEVRS
jgi:hypothetical protein